MLRRSCGPLWRPLRRLPTGPAHQTASYLTMSTEKKSEDRGSGRLKQLHQVLDGVAFQRKLSTSEGRRGVAEGGGGVRGLRL